MASGNAALLDEWRAAHESPVTGWDFSELTGGFTEEEPPWSYRQLARQVLSDAGSALDVGTGGGELLLELADALPGDTVATEGWAPNLPVASANLSVQGIPVVCYDAESDPTLPFPDQRFDVVLDRHEAYIASEIYRVLRPEGWFLTQQVDGRNFDETRTLFGEGASFPHVTLANFRAEVVDAGFEVTAAEEWLGRSRFSDVAALVRYLAYVPWEVPIDFSVHNYAPQLLDLHHAGHDLTFTQRRFYLCARRPGGNQGLIGA